MTNTRKLTLSGIIIGLYVAIMFTTQGFAFGQYQIRIATSLYALSYLYPFLIVPLGISNLLSNTFMGGLGIYDMVGGTLVGIIASTLVYLIRRYHLNKWLMMLPIIFVPGLLVPIWLSYLLNVPYKILAISICIGQIFPGILGVILTSQLQKVLKDNK